MRQREQGEDGARTGEDCARTNKVVVLRPDTERILDQARRGVLRVNNVDVLRPNKDHKYERRTQHAHHR